MMLNGIPGNLHDTGESKSQVSKGRILKSGRVVRKVWQNVVGYPRSKNVNVARHCWISQVTHVILVRANSRSVRARFQNDLAIVIVLQCVAKLRREGRVFL
ncbi:hypothetical protein E5676_scaffold83G00010 [Cucumis melo var. makuwa]|uniref:Uncharacterized protein n=1 Tax=Cucumis melo var. makuwa TaxID=1194695 RepID=A0A5A7TEF4_CUCMM|nr:hypothetical protein E6C27_scaffold67G001890 [Cucumis melo var. makuwa]TYK05337.1 hypothetical protein E5676_scaffold83G00010 [Cucumis melo var. makuwa]